MRRSTVVGTALGAMVSITLMVLAVIEDREERRLIAAGQCEVREDAWYQPPATSICTSRNEDGHCMMWQQYQPDPYLRSFWICDGGKSFWRRKVHE